MDNVHVGFRLVLDKEQRCRGHLCHGERNLMNGPILSPYPSVQREVDDVSVKDDLYRSRTIV